MNPMIDSPEVPLSILTNPKTRYCYCLVVGEAAVAPTVAPTTMILPQAANKTTPVAGFSLLPQQEFDFDPLDSLRDRGSRRVKRKN